jgi:hypothetical protein
MLNFLLRKAVFMQSCENENVFYLCVGTKRYIFRDGHYDGWYRP